MRYFVCGVCDHPDDYRHGVQSFDIRGYGIVKTCGHTYTSCASQMKEMLALAPGSADDQHVWFVKSDTERHYFKSLAQLTEWTKTISDPNSYQYAVSRGPDVSDVICQLWSGKPPSSILGEYKPYIYNTHQYDPTILWFVSNGHWVCHKFFFGPDEIAKFIKKNELEGIEFITDEGESQSDDLFFLANETKSELAEDGSDEYGNTLFISGWTCFETLVDDWKHGKFINSESNYVDDLQWTCTNKFITFQRGKEQMKIEHAQQQQQLLFKLSME